MFTANTNVHTTSHQFFTDQNSYLFRLMNNWLLVRSSKILILNKIEIGYLVNRALVVKSLARQIGIKNIHAHHRYKRTKCARSASWLIFTRCFLMCEEMNFKLRFMKENAVFWTWDPKTLIYDQVMKWSFAFNEGDNGYRHL